MLMTKRLTGSVLVTFHWQTVSTVEPGEPSLVDLWYVLCVLSAYRAYETSSEGLQLVTYAYQKSRSAKIAKFKSEDQQVVVTELQTHEQGLMGAR